MQHIDAIWFCRSMMVHLPGEAATTRSARPVWRVAVLQLLAIARYYASLCLAYMDVSKEREQDAEALPHTKHGARYAPFNCRF